MPRGPETVEQGLAICTALAPVIGYDAAAAIAHEASQTGETVRQVALRTTELGEAALVDILDAAKMTEPGFSGGGGYILEFAQGLGLLNEAVRRVPALGGATSLFGEVGGPCACLLQHVGATTRSAP